MKKNRRLGIDGFYAVDGATVRLCSDDSSGRDPEEKFAVQVVQGRLMTAYTRDQLIYEVRNPQTDVALAGYGQAEPELMIKIVTGFLNALAYNSKGFDENAIPKGMLQLFGDYQTEDQTAFKRYWNAMVKGVNNAWSIPVMFNRDPQGKAEFTKFGVEFNEMYFAKWMTFLTAIICAIYGMDPEEISFESFSSNRSSLSGSDTEEKIANSKDKGFRPFMAYYEQMMTDFICSSFDPKYCFRWVGLDAEDPKWVQERKKLAMSVDEMRAEMNLERWSQANGDGPDLGGAPINPTLIGPWMQAQQAQQPGPGNDFGGQPQPQGDFGEEQPDDAGGGPSEAGPQDEEGGGANRQPGQPPQDSGGDSGQPKQGGDFGKALTTIWSI
jgi:hypothetical protein